VLTLPGWLAVHAAFDGDRTIRLPDPATLVDFFTGETLTVPAGQPAPRFTVAMRRGDTRIWKVRAGA
jgi:hypothetical protein